MQKLLMFLLKMIQRKILFSFSLQLQENNRIFLGRSQNLYVRVLKNMTLDRLQKKSTRSTIEICSELKGLICNTIWIPENSSRRVINEQRAT